MTPYYLLLLCSYFLVWHFSDEETKMIFIFFVLTHPWIDLTVLDIQGEICNKTAMSSNANIDNKKVFANADAKQTLLAT